MYNEVVILGVIVSILFSEMTKLSPAGLIVPGYIALCLRTPERIVYTLAVALLACGCARLLGNVVILYGRRRFAVMILLAFALDLAVQHLGFLPQAPSLIGILVPGIIALEFDRQGVLRSLCSLGVVVGLISLILLCCGVSVLQL